MEAATASPWVASVTKGKPIIPDGATASLSLASPSSRLPPALRFPLYCALSLGLSALCYTGVSSFAGYELAVPVRDATENWKVASFLGWRILALAFGWFGKFDYQDLISLTCLVNLPYYYLLTTFYNIDNYAAIAALLVDILAVAGPVAFLRPLIHAHDTTPGRDANQVVAQDRSIYGLVSLFGSIIYSLVVYGSFYTWLPKQMVLHFDGLRSLEKAHNTGMPLLVPVLIPIGLACAHFLFAPSVGARGSQNVLRPANAAFSPSSATLGETVAWNLGKGPNGWTKRAEILARRTFTLAAATFVNTFVRVYSTIEGADSFGAAAWASVWATAALLTGIAFGWVGDA